MTGNLGERIERKSRQFRSAWHRSLAGSRKTFRSLEQRWRLHLLPFFTKRRARDVTTDLIRRYIRNRIEQSASPASINRELATLKHVFSLGMESTPPKVRIVPYILMFEERNVRSGFLKDEDYSALATECSKEGCGYARRWPWHTTSGGGLVKSSDCASGKLMSVTARYALKLGAQTMAEVERSR